MTMEQLRSYLPLFKLYLFKYRKILIISVIIFIALLLIILIIQQCQPQLPDEEIMRYFRVDSIFRLS